MLHWRLKIGKKTYLIGNFKNKQQEEEASKELYGALAGMVVTSPFPPLMTEGAAAGAGLGYAVAKIEEKLDKLRHERSRSRG